jgi:Galactose oxidase, central domain
MFSRAQRITTLLAVVAGLALATAQPVLLNASTWKRLSPITSPSARSLCAMAYDPVSDRIVLFGGLGNNSNFNDTWTFDGTTWTQIFPAVAPPPRNGATMAYDVVAKKLIMFGGFNDPNYLQDTWVFDGATSSWTEAQMSVNPPKATGAMLFTDPLYGRAMMFGGYNAGRKVPVESNTWRWTEKGWRLLHPATVPYPRAWGIANLDPLHHNAVLTGGTGDTIRADNTWLWDGVNWSQQSPSTQIPAYLSAGYTFDPAMQAVVVFGGNDDTWTWTGSDWVQMSPNSSPPPRSEVGMAYHPTTHQTLMFGGTLNNGTLVNTTWQLVGK